MHRHADDSICDVCLLWLGVTSLWFRHARTRGVHFCTGSLVQNQHLQQVGPTPGAGSPWGWPEGAEARMGQVNRCGLIPDVEKGAGR